jgi:RNA polymerase sigma-70 factor, ECF subfamily
VTDLDLLEGLRQRDPEVVARLLERYGDEIQAVAQLILRDRSEAEDVLIETLVTAWQRGHTVREPAALRAWLLRVATNHSLSLRRRLTRPLRQPRLLPGLTASADHAPAADTRLTVLAEIDRLPARMRGALVLHYYADLPVDEVAHMLGRSPNTVKAQLRVALDRLRTGLGG